MFEVELISDDQPEWNEFLLRDDRSLLYASNEYRRLIATQIRRKNECDSFCFVARDGRKIVGGFPLMILKTNAGSIANSLPFYGSNGGILVDPQLSENSANEVRVKLMRAIDEKIESEKCAAATVIANPLIPGQADWLSKNFAHHFLDQRIGQITSLPVISVPESKDDAIVETSLLKLFSDPRPRNIRKAIKSGVTVRQSKAAEDFRFLARTHAENMQSIGGIAKPESFFDLVGETMPAEMYRLYIAEKDSQAIAALLDFCFGSTVEYYTPCTLDAFRNLQPASLLIFEAMKDACREGFRYWNWGGTWASQQGVYDFKRKWGAKDYPYRYFVRVTDQSILKRSREELLKAFPNFYVAPFDQLSPTNS